MIDIAREAEKADVIIGGFAVQKCDEGFRVVNLNNQYGAAVLQKDGTLIETNMDDIELSIAKDYMFRSLKYMENL